MRTLLCTLIFLVLPSFHALAANVPAAPDVGAKAFLLLDVNSGRVLAERDADKPIEPASLTKMMTAYVVFNELAQGSISLSDQVRVSEKAWRMQGSRMFIEVNKMVGVEELLLGMIVQSGNDASVALAEHVAGGEEPFVALMNQQAARLGMSNTHFTNSTGLPHPEHFTTARDLAILARNLIEKFPEYYKWYKVKEYTYNEIRQYNRNRLLWLDERVDGIKTGHTESAGYCLVTSAVEDNMRLVSVVVGAKNENGRVSASRKLIGYGFRFYETYKLYGAKEQLTTMRVWKGEQEDVALGIEQDLYVTVPRGKRDDIQASMSVDAKIIAPVAAGQHYGTVDFKLGDEILAQQPLVALADVAEGGLWDRLVDSVLLLVE